MKITDVPIGTEFTFHNQVFVRLNHHENASGKLVNAWPANNPTDDGKLYFPTDVEVAVAEGVRTGKEPYVCVFSMEELVILRMTCAIAQIVGIDADTLANEFMRTDQSQAFHDCFASLVTEKQDAIEKARGEQS